MRAASNQADRLKGGEYSRETRYLGSNQERRNSIKNGEDDDYKNSSRVDPPPTSFEGAFVTKPRSVGGGETPCESDSRLGRGW